MKSIVFTAHGLPVGQPRPRACIRGRHASMYDPGTANTWKACVIAAARQAMDEAGMIEPMRGPVKVTAAFDLPRPKAHFGASGSLRRTAPAQPAKKPDIDNLLKAALDALTSAGVWLDDSQIVVIAATKRYGHSGNAAIAVQEVVE